MSVFTEQKKKGVQHLRIACVARAEPTCILLEFESYSTSDMIRADKKAVVFLIVFIRPSRNAYLSLDNPGYRLGYYVIMTNMLLVPCLVVHAFLLSSCAVC